MFFKLWFQAVQAFPGVSLLGCGFLRNVLCASVNNFCIYSTTFFALKRSREFLVQELLVSKLFL
jgi:hypothetical protein